MRRDDKARERGGGHAPPGHGLPAVRSPGASGGSPVPGAIDRVGDDGALMARSAVGDRSAFALVYERHAAPIMTFLAHALGDASTAEDLCQETFVRAWRAAPRFRRDAPLAPWLFRIARNLVGTEFRRRRVARAGLLGLFGRATRTDRADGADAGPAADSHAGPGSDGLARTLEAAVAALSERRRAAFVLVRMQGLSYDDAAALLDVPVGTVKSRAAAAEVELRRRLEARRPGSRS